MTRERILTGGVMALILLAVVCVPRHLSSSPRPAAVAPSTFHASVEQGSLVVRGSLPSEHSKVTILDQAHALSAKTGLHVVDQFIVDQNVRAAGWVDTVPQLLPILGLMVDRGSIMIDGRSIVVTGHVTGPREKADVLQAIAPAIRAGLKVEDRVKIVSTPPPPSSPTVSLPALQLSVNQVLAKSSIQFEPSSATITSKGQTTLDHIVTLLQRAPNTPIEISGHTDAAGKAENNMQLSRRRADVVKEYLTSHGLTNPFTTIGYGSTRPLSHRKHKPGLPKNERIEFLMLRTG
jgi:OmpA-OmpF porin, OOP family